MQDFALIKSAISLARFDSHRRSSDEPDEIVFQRYQWNAAVSECFYVPLTVLEVLLRNKFDTAIALNFGNPKWLITIPQWLLPSEKADIQKAHQYLSDRGREITQARLVQEMDFGFWSSFLSRRYETSIFRTTSARVFPCMDRSMRTRDNVSRGVEHVRKLRNRIFHYRRIWNRADLMAEYDRIIEVADWMDVKARPALISADCRLRLAAMLSQAP